MGHWESAFSPSNHDTPSPPGTGSESQEDPSDRMLNAVSRCLPEVSCLARIDSTAHIMMSKPNSHNLESEI